MGSGTEEPTHSSGKSRGGSSLLRRASACTRKGGEWWGRQRLDWDRVEIEQGEGEPSLVRHTEGKGRGVRWPVCSSEGGPAASSARRQRRRVTGGRTGEAHWVGGYGMMEHGSCLKNFGRPREKRDGLGPRKQCRVAAVN
jgi:hypothetical protein